MTKQIRNGGTTVKAGFYWNLSKWEIVPVSGEGGILPGGAEQRYFRVPVLLMLILAPAMGGLFAFFLPFIGFALLLSYVAKGSYALLQTAATNVGAMFGPSWRPGEAYFAGKRKQDAKTEAPKDEKLDELEKQIEDKRKDG